MKYIIYNQINFIENFHVVAELLRHKVSNIQLVGVGLRVKEMTEHWTAADLQEAYKETCLQTYCMKKHRA